jgi:hypothetical protein
MDANLLVRLSPLTTGPILMRRREISKAFTRAGLSVYNDKDTFNIKDLSGKISSLTNIKLEDDALISILEEFCNEGSIEHISGLKYHIREQIKIPNFEDLTQPVWDEFADFLKIRYGNFDAKIDYQVRLTVNSILLSMSLNIVQSQETQFESLPINDFRAIVESEAKNLKWKTKFTDIFCEYLLSSSPHLMDFIFNIYSGIINMDLISKEKEMPRFSLIDNVGFILVDTSFLVSLICKTEPNYALALAVSSQSNKRGIPLYYTKETKEEMRRFIRGSSYEMRNGLVIKGNPKVIKSQFVKDYIRLSSIEGAKWPDYFAALENWEQIVKLEHYISPIPENYNYNEDVYYYVKKMVPIFDQVRVDEQSNYVKGLREESQIDHDAICLGIVAKAREDHDEKASFGPWFLTFDNLIFAVGEFYKNTGKQDIGLVIQPRRWLNYLLTFSRTEFKDSDRNDVAKAIILFTARTDSKITLKDYSNLITSKLGLENEDRDIILEIFLKSPLIAELQRALLLDSGGDADRITQNIIENDKFIESVLNERQVKKDNERLKETIKNLNVRFREADSAKKALERSLSQRISIEIVTTSEINIQTKINGLISQLDAELPDGFEKNGIPEPPKVVSRVSKLKEWLTTTRDVIDTSNSIGEGAKALLPYIMLLIDTVSKLQ